VVKKKEYDCVIVGGGPAGISAAIYLGRFNRSVLVIDSENTGRWHTHEINENYLGFPDGIPTIRLRELGKQQAEKFGAVFIKDTVTVALKQQHHFICRGETGEYQAKTLLLATGVTDNYPQFPALKECLGNSLFWCITCDGHKTIDKHVLIVGASEEALTTALQFLNYTHKITIVTNTEPGEWKISDVLRERLQKHAIPVHEGKIAHVASDQGFIISVSLTTGEVLPTDFMFNLQEAVPNIDLARQLSVATDAKGYILTENEQRTNIPRLYAAGDVTKAFAHQIVTAAHEGATAAQTANYELYHSYQKEE
jgi:thioredoxin reductase (NADPH)